MELFEFLEMVTEDSKYVVCDHCHGYGSSLKEDADRCTKCEGKGLFVTCDHCGDNFKFSETTKTEGKELLCENCFINHQDELKGD